MLLTETLVNETIRLITAGVEEAGVEITLNPDTGSQFLPSGRKTHLFALVRHVIELTSFNLLRINHDHKSTGILCLLDQDPDEPSRSMAEDAGAKALFGKRTTRLRVDLRLL